VEAVWIAVAAIGTIVLVVLTAWLVVLARRPAVPASPSSPAPPAPDEPEVTVEVANLFETYERDLGPWSFSVTGVNRSDHPVRFTSAGFERGDGKQIVITQQPYGSTLIGTVPSHDSGQTWMDCDSLESAGLDTYGEIVGWARTATGELYRSEPKTLRSP
jgi:hypothetical protein